MTNDPADIRKFIQENFSDPELNNFCFDYFRVVYDDFAAGMVKSQKVRLLVAYAQRHGRFPDLLVALERERPQAFRHAFGAAPAVAPPLPQPIGEITRNPRRVFISHAHQEYDFARQLAGDLRAHGWETWLAPDSIRPGEKWVEAINRGLAESGVFVLVLTQAAVDSSWVRIETNTAVQWDNEGKLRFIPLCLTKAAPDNTPALWQAYQQVRFDNGRQAGLEALLTELQPRALHVNQAGERQLVRRRRPTSRVLSDAELLGLLVLFLALWLILWGLFLM